jgi:CRP-like cAMP-binding protein
MDLIDLFKNADSSQFATGSVIFAEGDQGDCMYVVLEGAVALTVNGTEVHLVAQGEIFGEMALIDEKVRSATATAECDTKLAVVDTKRFDFTVQNTPTFARHVMRVLADRVRGTNQQL